MFDDGFYKAIGFLVFWGLVLWGTYRFAQFAFFS